MTEAGPQPSALGRQSDEAAARAAGARAETLFERTGRPRSLTRETIRQLGRNPGAVVGSCLLIAIVLVSIFATAIAPDDPDAQDTSAIRQAPNRAHVFGTDNFGRDVYSRVLVGGRRSLPVGFIAVAIAVSVGVMLGLIAGYYGRWIDSLVMRSADLMLAFPGILLAMSIIAILGSSLFNLMLAVGIAAIPEYTRVVRGMVLSTREMEYVTAARVNGAGGLSIMLRHIFPNVLPPVIVLVTLGIAGAIILGSTLSFLGLGVKPPTAEWGSMLSDGRTMMRHHWWVSFFPGFAIMLTVLSMNLFGDGLRDALDPRLRRR